jgi:hypothetical protein
MVVLSDAAQGGVALVVGRTDGGAEVELELELGKINKSLTFFFFFFFWQCCCCWRCKIRKRFCGGGWLESKLEFPPDIGAVPPIERIRGPSSSRLLVSYILCMHVVIEIRKSVVGIVPLLDAQEDQPHQPPISEPARIPGRLQEPLHRRDPGHHALECVLLVARS